MAQEKAGGSGKDIKPDSFIERVIPDPSDPRVIRIAGQYLGRSDREDCWRLYLTDALNHFLEFRREDTLDAQKTSTGRMVVWLKKGSNVEETITGPVPTDFLRGNLRRNLAGQPSLGIQLPRFLLCETSDQGTGNSMCIKKTRDPGSPECAGR